MNRFLNLNAAKVALLSTIFASLILFVACSDKSSPSISASRNTFTEILLRKQIHAAILIYPPTVDLQKGSAKPSGFLIDVMDEIAKRAGMTITYEPTTWDDLKAAVTSARYDIVVGGVFVNVPRAKDMAFTIPIMYWQGVGVVVPAEKESTYKSLADLNKPSIRITATAGTVEYDFVKQNLPLATINPIPNDDMTLTMTEVGNGRADAAFANFDTIKKYVPGKPSLAIAFGGKAFGANAAGFVVKLEDAEWLQFLNNSILSLQVDGTIKSLSDKYKAEATWTLPRNQWE